MSTLILPLNGPGISGSSIGWRAYGPTIAAARDGRLIRSG
jgi:hypothetical protein